MGKKILYTGFFAFILVLIIGLYLNHKTIKLYEEGIAKTLIAYGVTNPEQKIGFKDISCTNLNLDIFECKIKDLSFIGKVSGKKMNIAETVLYNPNLLLKGVKLSQGESSDYDLNGITKISLKDITYEGKSPLSDLRKEVLAPYKMQGFTEQELKGFSDLLDKETKGSFNILLQEKVKTVNKVNSFETEMRIELPNSNISLNVNSNIGIDFYKNINELMKDEVKRNDKNLILSTLKDFTLNKISLNYGNKDNDFIKNMIKYSNELDKTDYSAADIILQIKNNPVLEDNTKNLLIRKVQNVFDGNDSSVQVIVTNKDSLNTKDIITKLDNLQVPQNIVVLLRDLFSLEVK